MSQLKNIILNMISEEILKEMKETADTKLVDIKRRVERIVDSGNRKEGHIEPSSGYVVGRYEYKDGVFEVIIYRKSESSYWSTYNIEYPTLNKTTSLMDKDKFVEFLDSIVTKDGKLSLSDQTN